MSKPHKKVLTFGTDTAKPEIGKAGNVASNPISVRFSYLVLYISTLWVNGQVSGQTQSAKIYRLTHHSYVTCVESAVTALSSPWVGSWDVHCLEAASAWPCLQS